MARGEGGAAAFSPMLPSFHGGKAREHGITCCRPGRTPTRDEPERCATCRIVACRIMVETNACRCAKAVSPQGGGRLQVGGSGAWNLPTDSRCQDYPRPWQPSGAMANPPFANRSKTWFLSEPHWSWLPRGAWRLPKVISSSLEIGWRLAGKGAHAAFRRARIAANAWIRSAIWPLDSQPNRT